MKNRSPIVLQGAALLAAALLFVPMGMTFAAPPIDANTYTQVYEGKLSVITVKEVTVDGFGTYKIDPRAQCFDARKDKTGCATLAAVGYAQKGRISLSGVVVKRIDVLELYQ